MNGPFQQCIDEMICLGFEDDAMMTAECFYRKFGHQESALFHLLRVNARRPRAVLQIGQLASARSSRCDLLMAMANWKLNQ